MADRAGLNAGLATPAQSNGASARFATRSLRVLLINMPFVSLSRPAIGISILKARLVENHISCRVGYANLLFAERVGTSAYELINDQLSGSFFAGDWLFSEYLFPELDRTPYISTLRQHLDNDVQFDTVMALRGEIGPFLDSCFEAFDIEAHDIVGFTTTFEQNLASLALAKCVKSRYPEKITVLGGGNCEGVMGLELHRRFPWIDYVCSGESDDSFLGLVKRLTAGDPPDELPGVIFRQDGQSRLAAPPDRVRDMDRVPDPDYDDYFAAMQRSSVGAGLKPALLIESARGCWWGEKSHCTFCGLNGSTMAFRAKSASRVYAELARQKDRYGTGQFLAVDNIMSYEYFRDLLPMLKERNPGISLFYEIKSNLKRMHVEMLRDAGVLAIQPGIESLSSHVLKLMRKGVTAIQNVQLLKLCREYGIELAWNLLYGFPGETAQDYEDTARVIQAIYHLKPPGAVARIRLDRFSPYYDHAEEFGLAKVRPFPIYNHIYHLPQESVANLAYFFDFEYQDGRTATDYVQPALEAIRLWKENRGGDLVKRYGTDPELMLLDDRLQRQPLQFPLNGLQREIYDFCDEIRSRSSIEAFVAERTGSQASVDYFLDDLVGHQIMLREGNQFLSLAVDTGRSTRPVGTPEPAMF
jgi:ribosomal peptide maturation radical SAM protein 1